MKDSNVILCEAESVRNFGKCHLAQTRLYVPARRGIDVRTGEALGEMNLEISWRDYVNQDVWVIRTGLREDGPCSGCNVTHARNGQEAMAAWRKFLGLRYQILWQDPGIFVYIDGEEAVYWDTSDKSHSRQGLEIARSFQILFECGVEAFLDLYKRYSE